MNLKDSIQSLMLLEGDPIHEIWMRLKKLVLQFPSHGLRENCVAIIHLLKLEFRKKGVADQLSPGVLMH